MARDGSGETRASSARVYEHWRGGPLARQHDRVIADEMARIQPQTADMVRSNRVFLARAITWTARQGISQFLDLGAGLPSADSTHHAARAVIPDARVVYVDKDTAAVMYHRADDKADGVKTVLADIRDPATVLPELQLLDLAQPVCLIFGAVLHFMAPKDARRLVAQYVDAIAPGSVVIVSVARNEDPEAVTQLRSLFAPTGLTINDYTARAVEKVLAGLQLVPPGVVQALAWRPRWEPLAVPPATAYALVAVSRKL